MIVTAVACRTLSVRRARKRLPETVRLRMDVPVEIAEVAEGEVPLAARVVTPSSLRKEFHARDGAFARPLQAGAVRGERVGEYFSGTLHGGPRPTFCRLRAEGEAPRIALELPSDPDAGVREILSDDGEAVAAEVRRVAAAHLLVGGALWMPTGEPAWRIVHDGANPARLDAGPAEDDLAAAVFRLDRAEEADRYVQDICHFRRRRYEGRPPRVELLAFAPRLDDRLASAVALGCRLSAALAEGAWLHLLPREAILRWCELREDVAAAGDAEAIARGAGRLLAEIRRLPLNRAGIRDHDALLRALNEPLLRWTAYEGGVLDGADLDPAEDAALAAIGGAA